jgi:hypothetical protein
MRHKVLVYLNGSHPGLRLVVNLSFTANSHNGRVIQHGVDHQLQGIWHDAGVRIHHQTRFVHVRRHAGNATNLNVRLALKSRIKYLVVQVEFQGRHAVV